MRDIKFKVWHRKDQKLYYRGYQKLAHVLLCEDDKGSNDGNGTPVKRASYEDCEFLESTSLQDKNGVEIFESDLVKVAAKNKTFKGVVPPVPDMFRSRNIHPLDTLLREHGIAEEDILEIEVIGNDYESKK